METASRLVSWYGDDFTGSTDVLEALASNGVRSVLFLEQPDEEFFAHFQDYSAFGIAGSSRSQTLEWMDEHLPSVFDWMRGLGTALCHYKVCSTFDSAPGIGNIGRAIEIGSRAFNARTTPVMVGAPSLRRYVVFGNLFATANGQTYRIDRHPTMSVHPVTPMHESDLGLHLSQQTKLPVSNFHLLDLQSSRIKQRYDAVAEAAGIVLLDTIDQATLEKIGGLLWDGSAVRPFVAGSSGVEYALTSWWRSTGMLDAMTTQFEPESTDRLLVLSGSCSPVTRGQIADAGKSGFELIPLNVRALAGGEGREFAMEDAIGRAAGVLAAGRSALLYTSGAVEDTVELSGSGDNGSSFRSQLGEYTGRVLCGILDRSGVRRVVVAGGDTSSYAGKQMGIRALTYVAPLAPGAPLCRAWSKRADRDGLEIVFKGGQCGADDFFTLARHGRLVRAG